MSKRFQRICFYGGPCAGKSTAAAELFAALKRQHKPVEYIDEVIKPMAWMGVLPQGFTSGKLFFDQIYAEEAVLRNNGIVVSAGPPMQQCAYMLIRKEPIYDHLSDIASMYEAMYPAINIYLDRDVPFSTFGRYQKTLDEAESIDLYVRRLLDEHGVVYKAFKSTNHDAMFAFIDKKLVTVSTEEPKLEACAL